MSLPILFAAYIPSKAAQRVMDSASEVFFFANLLLSLAPKLVIRVQVEYLNRFGDLSITAGLQAGTFYVDSVLPPVFYRAGGGSGGRFADGFDRIVARLKRLRPAAPAPQPRPGR